MLGKKTSEKSAKKVFLYSHEYRDQKMGWKTRETNFQKHRYSARKKSSEKRAKKVFLHSHEYRDQKVGGTKRAKQFFQKHINSASKKCWEKNRRKKCEKRFFIFTRIS